MIMAMLTQSSRFTRQPWRSNFIQAQVFVLNIPPVMENDSDNHDRESRNLLSVCSLFCRQATWPHDRQPRVSLHWSDSPFHSLLLEMFHIFLALCKMFAFETRRLHRSVMDAHWNQLLFWLQTRSRRCIHCSITSEARFWSADKGSCENDVRQN